MCLVYSHMLVSNYCLLHSQSHASCMQALSYILFFYFGRYDQKGAPLVCVPCRTCARSSRSILFHVCLFTIHSVSAWLYLLTYYTVLYYTTIHTLRQLLRVFGFERCPDVTCRRGSLILTFVDLK